MSAQYEKYLRALLAPLGIYTPDGTGAAGGELYALGAGLDEVSDRLETAEREALTMTAEEEGLSRREALFARAPAAATAAARRAAIAALLQINGDSLTPLAINRTMGGCGIRAEALEMGQGHIRIIFPDVAGVPAEFGQIQKIILDIIPCHLETEFYFRYLTWNECESRGFTWAYAEGREHTWESFELDV